MAEKMDRTQILLKPEQHKTLAELSKQQNKSISELVRDYLDQVFEKQKQEEERKEKQLALLEEIRQNNEEIKKNYDGELLQIDVVEMINNMRDEHDNRIFELAKDFEPLQG